MSKEIKKIQNICKKLIDENKKSECYNLLKDITVESLMMMYSLTSENKNKDESFRLLKILDQFEPNLWQVHINKCDWFYKNKMYDEAAKSIMKAISCPGGSNTDTLYNYAVIKAETKDKNEAIKTYRKILNVFPEHKKAIYNLSSELITSGNWNEGWKLYEKRFFCYDNLNQIKQKFSNYKELTNITKNKKIIIYNEQGVGDLFNYIRFVDVFSSNKNKIIILCKSNMKNLLVSSKLPSTEIIDNFDDLGKISNEKDYAVSVCSLPAILKIQDNKTLFTRKYLNTNKKIKIPKLSKSKKNIGVFYYGNANHPLDWKRSIKLSKFLKCVDVKNINLYSLQIRENTIRNHNYETVNMEDSDNPFIDLSNMIHDYEDTAAILKQLDLLITVDSSIAHLAGAMNVPTWILLDYNNDFRWGSEGDKTNWYPSMRVFRQHKIYEWDHVLENVKNQLMNYSRLVVR